MTIKWVENADGSPIFGESVTDMAIEVIQIGGNIEVMTRKSIYTFEKI